MWIMSARPGPLRIAAALVALSILGCGGASGGKSRVEQGESVSTGVTAYDTFFRELSELSDDVDRTGAEFALAAKPLQEVAGDAKGPPPEAVRTEAKKLQMAGTLLHLDLVPETKLVTSAKPDASSEKLLGAAEQAAKGSLAAARRAAEVLARIADLQKRRAELISTASASFADSSRRSEVTRELDAAGKVLDGARAAVEKHGGAASKLALDLAMALETGAGSSAVAGKKPGGAKPGGAGTKPGGAGTTAPAKPKGDDFDR